MVFTCGQFGNGDNKEAELHRETLLSTCFVENLPGFCYLLDLNGTLLRWNRELQEKTCLPAEALRGMDFLSIVCESDQELFSATLARAVTQAPVAGELRIRTGEGARDYLMTGNRIEIAGVPHFLGNGVDITERKCNETTLLRQLGQVSQVSRIFDELDVIVLVSEFEACSVFYLNRPGAQLFGADWLGKSCNEVAHCGEAFPCNCECAARPKAGGGRDPDPHEYQNAETGRWFQCVPKAIPWVDGRLVRMSVVTDVTGSRELALAMENMVSTVSHEMRTPLTAMFGYTRILQEKRVGQGELHEYLRIIARENERLIEMVSNFLDLQRMKAATKISDPPPLEIAPLLEESAALFAKSSKRHRVGIDTPLLIPPVMMDAEPLLQILDNLLSNAIKYSPRGGAVTLGVTPGGEFLVIWVKDEGVGIAPELQGRIFERFYQAGSGAGRSFRGTGLGLSLVQEIVAAHGGRVWVESLPGAGSTFYASLPVAKGKG
jgi:two-component system, OmpR family, phosphate regulon sensor histidine kinase PhoR